MSSNAQVGLFVSERLCTCARVIGGCIQREDQQGFVLQLVAIGISAEEAAGYWNARSVHHSAASEDVLLRRIQNAQTNTQLAHAFGISLNSNMYPRNLLLYKIVEGVFPHSFRIRVRGSEHMGGKKSRRHWQTGMPPKRRLLFFSFPLCSKHEFPCAVWKIYKGEGTFSLQQEKEEYTRV